MKYYSLNIQFWQGNMWPQVGFKPRPFAFKMYVLYLNLLQKKWIYLHNVLKDNHVPAQFFQQGKPQQKANRKPNQSTEKFREGTRVVIPHKKGPSEEHRCTLVRYKDTVCFKGTSIMKLLLMHPKDPISHAQKSDIIYHWKSLAHNCTAEYIDETKKVPQRKSFRS